MANCQQQVLVGFVHLIFKLLWSAEDAAFVSLCPSLHSFSVIAICFGSPLPVETAYSYTAHISELIIHGNGRVFEMDPPSDKDKYWHNRHWDHQRLLYFWSSRRILTYLSGGCTFCSIIRGLFVTFDYGQFIWFALSKLILPFEVPVCWK